MTLDGRALQRFSRQSKSVAPNSPEATIRSTHTPPRSITTSFDSDTDADNEATHPTSSSSKNKSKRRSPTQSLRSSVLLTRRQERRAKRNMSLREKEMDARMSKIESDNIMLRLIYSVTLSRGLEWFFVAHGKEKGIFRTKLQWQAATGYDLDLHGKGRWESRASHLIS
ncbi:hypothetical protein DL98DRAFT_610526 [Cadophora sp. DSE1049]|nr:hypothetical protein DL98DRAFT_610526 [Cadophora sp. DSE1049]